MRLLRQNKSLLGRLVAIDSRAWLVHQREVGAYLAEQDRRWDRARKGNPPDLVEKARRYRKEKDLRPA